MALGAPRSEVPDVGISVERLEEAIGFYGTLGFAPGSSGSMAGPAFERLVGLPGASATFSRLHLGGEVLLLTRYERGAAAHPAGAVRSDAMEFQHLALVVNDVDRAWSQLRKPLRVSVAPQTLPASNATAAGVRAAYFRSPEGHAAEFLSFPPGKGAARWRRVAAGPLGVDHTALVVSDTARSLAFYCDGLGFSVASQSVNRGREQASLTAVEGAEVRITELRHSQGGESMGIELLEYLSPHTPRPAASPSGSRPPRWETYVAVRDVEATLSLLGVPGAVPVDTRELQLGYDAAALLADPDGHAVRLVTPSTTHGAR